MTFGDARPACEAGTDRIRRIFARGLTMNNRFTPLKLVANRTHPPAAFVITALGILLAAPPCFPQTAGIPDAGNVGVPINGAFSGSNIDSVQLNNGDLHIDIPLLDIPGLGVPVRIHFISRRRKSW